MLDGIAGDRAIYARSLGSNMNAICAGVLVETGGILLLLARAAARRPDTRSR